VLLDTTVLIDLQREAGRGTPGPACALLEAHKDERVCISAVTVGEFAEEFPPGEGDALRAVLSGFAVIAIDERTAYTCAGLSRSLRAEHRRMGDNDLWIAATALAEDLPLVTRDARHLGRVASLRLLSY